MWGGVWKKSRLVSELFQEHMRKTSEDFVEISYAGMYGRAPHKVSHGMLETILQ